MGTRKHRKSNKRFRKTRSKRQRGGTQIDDLFRWSTEGNINRVGYALAKGSFDVDVKDNEGYTVLIKASKFGHKELMEFLLEWGANVNAMNNYGNTALIEAIDSREMGSGLDMYNKKIDLVKILLEKGADVNIRQKEQNGKPNMGAKTALIMSTLNSMSDINILLIEAGADVNVWYSDYQSYNNNTVLQIAVMHNDKASVKLLLDAGADVNANWNENAFMEEHNTGITALMYATGRGHVEIVKILLNAGADVNLKSNYEDIDDEAEQAYLLEHFPDQEEDWEWLLDDNHIYMRVKETALIWACERGLTDIVKLLLANGANIEDTNAYNKTPLEIASENGHTETVNLLTKHIVAQTVPKILERQEDRKNLKMVMSEKPVERKFGEHRMPPEIEHEIGQYLGGGKRKSRKTKKSNKRFRKTRSKRQRGGRGLYDIDLIRASTYGDTKIVEMLLKKGADVNAKDDDGNTALMEASDCDNLNIDLPAYQVEYKMQHKTEIVEMLLDNGADVNAMNDDGETAFDLANSNECTYTHNPKTIKLLQKYAAAQTIPKRLKTQRERKKDRQNLHMVMSKKGVHPDLERFAGYYLGGKKRRKTRKS